MNKPFTELLFIHKSRGQIRSGDIFVFQPKSTVFYWAKVIKAKLESKDPFYNGMHLIYVFNCCTSTYDNIPEFKLNNLLFHPIVVNAKGWRDGYFLTVSNQPVSKEELNLSFGFWDDITNQFKNEHGDVINGIPKWHGLDALYSYGFVGRETHRTAFGANEISGNLLSILENDLALDMREDFKKLSRKYDLKKSFKLLLESYSTSFTDVDEEPLATLSFAQLQLDQGILWEDIKEKTLSFIESGKVIEMLVDCSEEVIDYNQEQLTNFKNRIKDFKN